MTDITWGSLSEEEKKKFLRSYRLASYNLHKEEVKKHLGRDLKDSEVVFINGGIFGHPDAVDEYIDIMKKWFKPSFKKFSDYEDCDKSKCKISFHLSEAL